MNTADFKTVATVLGIGFIVLMSLSIFLSYRQGGVAHLPGERGGGVCTDTPQFKEYEVKDMPPSDYIGVQDVNFDSNQEARNFETSIKEWFTRGPQSGGYFAVAEWGCGTSCQAHAVIDIRDGIITAFGLPSTHGIGYRTDSNMLVINPLWNVSSDVYRIATVTTEFYELVGGIPSIICKIINSPYRN